MTNIDIYVIDPEYGAHLFHNCRASSLYTICPQDFVDMVCIDIVDTDQWILRRRELPKTGNIRAIRRELCGRLSEWRHEKRSGDLTTIFPPLSSPASWKQSTIPGISLTTVFAQVRSTNPTSNNLGTSAPNLTKAVSDIREHTGGSGLPSAGLCISSP